MMMEPYQTTQSSSDGVFADLLSVSGASHKAARHRDAHQRSGEDERPCLEGAQQNYPAGLGV